MAVDLMAQLSGLLPIIKIGAMVFVGFIILAVAGYYFFIVRNRKKWMLRIFEQKSDGRLHLIGFDELQEKKANGGKTTFYWLSKLKQETTPPPWEAVDRVGTKDFADYIRIRHAVMPMTKSNQVDWSNPVSPNVQKIATITNSAMKAIKTSDKYKTAPYKQPIAIEHRFVYVPINKVPHINVGYNQMDYDIDVMRINQIDNMDKMFSAQKGFMEKYGMFIMIGLLIVAVIVIAYLSFEYMRDVISQNLAATQDVVNAIKGISGFGGTPPPSQ